MDFSKKESFYFDRKIEINISKEHEYKVGNLIKEFLINLFIYNVDLTVSLRTTILKIISKEDYLAIVVHTETPEGFILWEKSEIKKEWIKIQHLSKS